MDWIQFFGLLGTMLAGFGFIYKEIKDEIRIMKNELFEQSKRSDLLNSRTDKLYEMFIDLVKERK